MFENAFNNIDKVMRNDEGLASELDYAEQTSWLLFLKYLDDLESEREARARLREQMPGNAGPVRFTQSVSAQGDWKRQLTTLAGWARIARNYFHTLGRIYKSVILGFLIAGFIVTLMPAQAWRTLFLGSATLPGVLENAAMGVTAGVLSFIGSIGNVPFAAALWVGGVSFAGVIACIYADLITIPVLSLWRKFFGWKAMLYIFGVFFLTMTSSAVLMECLFRALHWIPPRLSSASFEAFVRFRFGATFGVTLAALVGTAVLYGLMRLQTRTDRGAGTSGGLELLVTRGCSMGCVPDRGDVPGRILRLALPIRRYVMTDKAATQTEEHTYQCPKCNCEFTRGEDEPEVCKCKQCGSEVDTGKKTCSCCA